jgi:UDP-glucose 4-epimerase
MGEARRILVTGAAGKVGRLLIDRVLGEPGYADFSLRPLCHNRQLEPNARVEIMRGSIEQCAVVEQAMQGVTHAGARPPQGAPADLQYLHG